MTSPSQDQDLRTALDGVLREYDGNTCQHEDTYRGGSIWTICDACGQKWADDEGGFKPYVDPPAVARAREILCQEAPAQAPDKAGEREGAEDDARDAQYKAEQAEEAECDALFRAETAEAEITRLQAIIAALAPQPTGTEASRGVVQPLPTPAYAYQQHEVRGVLAATPTPPLLPDSTGHTELDRLRWERNHYRRQWIAALTPSAPIAAEKWDCAAKGSVGANDPQECNWPLCGCDPHAEKVVAALQECDLLKSAPIAAPVRYDGARDALRTAFMEGFEAGHEDAEEASRPLHGGRGVRGPQDPEVFWLRSDALASLPAPAGDVPGEAQTGEGWRPIAELKPQTNAVLGRWQRCGDNEDGSEFWYWQEATGRWFEHAGEVHWCLRSGRFDHGPFYGEAPTHFHSIPEKPARVEAQTQEGGR